MIDKINIKTFDVFPKKTFFKKLMVFIYFIQLNCVIINRFRN